MMLLFQLFILLLLSISITSIFKNKIVKTLLSIIFSIFIGLQAVSIYMGGSVIDLKFYANFNLKDILVLAKAFIFEGVVFSLLIILLIFFIYKISIVLRKKINLYILISLSFFSIIYLSFNEGKIFNSIYTIVQLKNVTSKAFDESLKDLGITDYTAPKDVEATAGKNIVILSLESLENGYLQDDLKDVCPNLNKYKKEYNYYVMNQGPASNWTAASLYTYFTGFPMYFSTYGNDIFKGLVYTKISSISDVFNKAGYNQFYLMGDNEHAGINDFLKTYEVPFYEQSYYDEKYGVNDNGWGLQDFDLFKEAKLKVKELSKSDKPFVLYLSTISTHFPDGIYDKRMEKFISPKDSDIEFMAAATDYMVANFINYLKQENILDNTVFYIFPDHLLMGNGTSVLSKFDKRQLYLITNATEKELGYNNDNRINQIDLPEIILKGAGIKHNIKFLNQYVGDSPLTYINEHQVEILRINEASLFVKPK